MPMGWEAEAQGEPTGEGLVRRDELAQAVWNRAPDDMHRAPVLGRETIEHALFQLCCIILVHRVKINDLQIVQMISRAHVMQRRRYRRLRHARLRHARRCDIGIRFT